MAEISSEKVAGHYASGSEEMRKRAVLLSGEDLYLFPDGTYIHLQWCDIPPVVIDDTGTWVVSNGLVKLRSHPEVTWRNIVQREYLVLRHDFGSSKPILLIGISSDIPYFEKNAKKDPEFMLLMLSRVRTEDIKPENSDKVKTNLMKESWQPEFFNPTTK